MSDLEVIKLDGRFNGSKNFRYAITPARLTRSQNSTLSSRVRLWREARVWCYATWGPSIELDEWEDELMYNEDLTLVNKHWSWYNHPDHRRMIYLKGDEELVLFNLRWA